MKAPTLFILLSALLVLPASSQTEKEREETSKARSSARAEVTVEARAKEKASSKSSKRKAAERKGRAEAAANAQEKAEKKSGASTAPSMEKSAFLGVATSLVPPSLREHLELSPGFGIQVQEVVEGSPAAKGGLRKHDILVRYGDQRLISPEHLSLLVRDDEPGDTVTLAAIRKGREVEVKVELGETERNVFHFGSVRPRPGAPPFSAMPPRGMSPQDSKRWQEYLRKQQDHWRNWMDNYGPNDGPSKPSPDASKDDKDETPAKTEAGDRKPSFPVTVFGSAGVIRIDNQKGEVTITNKDGASRIEIRDTKGEVLHEGDFDPEKGTKSLPKEARQHLEDMNLGDLEMLTPEGGLILKKTSISTRTSSSDRPL